jgi:hypothetical protein
MSLPPRVNGRIHGSLRLAVEAVEWRVVRPPLSTQVRVKFWGEKGYGALLRPANCSRGPALASTVFYSVRCSRRSMLEYLNDAETVTLDIVDEVSHDVVAHATVPLAGLSPSAPRESTESIREGPVGMYSADGHKVGEVHVAIDVHFKASPQRTSMDDTEVASDAGASLQVRSRAPARPRAPPRAPTRPAPSQPHPASARRPGPDAPRPAAPARARGEPFHPPPPGAR